MTWLIAILTHYFMLASLDRKIAKQSLGSDSNPAGIVGASYGKPILFAPFVVSSLLIVSISIIGCQSSSRNESYVNVSEASIGKGKKLAGQYCQSCHQLPSPKLLDAKTWKTGALPAMGPLLGIFNHDGQSYTYHGDMQMMGPGYLASHPKVTKEEWQHIVDYFTATSPDKLPPQKRNEKISEKLPLFEVLSSKLNYANSHISFVKIREHKKASVVASDAIIFKTYLLNSRLSPIDSLITDGPIVDIKFITDSTALACNIGIIKPNNDPLGSIVKVRQVAEKKWKVDTATFFDGLRRPLQVLTADLNKDSKTDYLVCEFGYFNGSLSWMENKGKNQYQKHVLSALPGAIKAYLLDYNRDGALDIISMFAQGEEGIFLFTNNGNGNFSTKELLRFPAVYGSSHFELADFNKDGLPDILYTCGDNADYTTILKPYHGVYIFLNKGDNHFEQSFFYPIHGCYKAMAVDFDKDGDLDLATIAHYADFATQPEEGFVYFENVGDLKFSPHSSSKLEVGRWITMDVGDIDGDGWPDIVLGNFVQPSRFANPNVDWSKAPPIMILKNKGHE